MVGADAVVKPDILVYRGIRSRDDIHTFYEEIQKIMFEIAYCTLKMVDLFFSLQFISGE